MTTTIEITRTDHRLQFKEEYSYHFFMELLELYVKKGLIKSFEEGSDGWNLIQKSGVTKTVIIRENGKVLLVKPSNPGTKNEFSKFIKEAGIVRHWIHCNTFIKWGENEDRMPDLSDDFEALDKFEKITLKYSIEYKRHNYRVCDRVLKIYDQNSGLWI